MLAHLPVYQGIYKTVVGNIGQYAFTILFNKMRAITNEFYVIIRQRLYVLFIQVFFIISQQALYPFAFITAAHRIRRVAHDHHNRRIALDMISLVGFFG